MAGGDRARFRAVVVDDNPPTPTLLRAVLDYAGDFSVVGEAGDGSEAVHVCEILQPDVVLLDLQMPTMDGIEAIPLIRRQCPAVRIVVFSGLDAPSARSYATRVGADAYMVKGVPPATVLATVRSVLARHQRRSAPLG